MSRGAAHAAWSIALVLQLSGAARAQAPAPPPPPAEPYPMGPALPPPPPVAVTPPPGAAHVVPFARRPFIELTTLRMLREKGVITDEEYGRSLKQFTDWLGVKGDDSITFAFGKWKTTIYGFVEGDAMYHTTQSFSDTVGNAQVKLPTRYEGKNGRWMFSVRNSRIGLRIGAPDLKHLKTSGVFEMDFLGNGALNPGQSFAMQSAATGAVTEGYNPEGPYFTNPVLRVRHAYLKLETPILDIVMGQTWNLVGYQPFYIPAILEIPGVVGGLFGRTPQLRLSHNFKSPVASFEIAAAILRGPQRDAGLPEGQAGVRLTINKWNGLHSSFLSGTSVQPLSIAVSGAMRGIKAPDWGDPDNAPAKTQVGWLGAADIYIPLLPARDLKSASLSILGEFAQGEGVNDLYTGLTGGVPQMVRKPATSMMAPNAVGIPVNLDPGLAIYDFGNNMPTNPQLTLIAWRSWLANLEFFVPGTTGRLCLFGTYSHTEMTNAQALFGASSAHKSTTATERDHEDMFDAGLFVDVYPGAVRFAADWQYLIDYYVDPANQGGTIKAENHAVQVSGFLFF